ncbi:unnamed protein product [Onchocerca ochengi]|uniref:Nudix hydrolase domain-containing protein n=1 Tax=Onchocerca ochengi TaxID=42157 RepID=A0A182EHE2_ONCOC|nr:unnamed protein product [Onchocerca ochengi]
MGIEIFSVVLHRSNKGLIKCVELKEEYKKDRYRSCVGIMLLNKQGHVFVGKRFESDFYWQMPQGGINDGEELEQAALRELLEEIYSSVGVHPLDATVGNGEFIHVDELVEFAKNQKIISIGETGLDFYELDNKNNQRKSFASHIEAARITGLPLVIHTRNADCEMIDMLKSEMKIGAFSGVVHCFASSKELAYQAMDLGLYISFSGIITFKSANSLRKIAQNVLRGLVLVETDAPYLSPEPYRGKKNEPAMIKYIINCLAELWNESPNKVAEITTNNFSRLFVKLNPEKKNL